MSVYDLLPEGRVRRGGIPWPGSRDEPVMHPDDDRLPPRTSALPAADRDLEPEELWSALRTLQERVGELEQRQAGVDQARASSRRELALHLAVDLAKSTGLVMVSDAGAGEYLTNLADQLERYLAGADG